MPINIYVDGVHPNTNQPPGVPSPTPPFGGTPGKVVVLKAVLPGEGTYDIIFPSQANETAPNPVTFTVGMPIAVVCQAPWSVAGTNAGTPVGTTATGIFLTARNFESAEPYTTTAVGFSSLTYLGGPIMIEGVEHGLYIGNLTITSNTYPNTVIHLNRLSGNRVLVRESRNIIVNAGS